ncbi:serine hydrolase domain-containing protein [Enterovibrio coralii]|uniref:Beta-lactamase-related domain-containing protein n=1 Tax=Enterovibrio coralii TaxID=294935 RepID=A0A135I8Q8_9GAMM|nr:serine hydrolase [Enterovibrio coralii]KXF81842.1 hypothetical protein ATN88_20305 [Enterovibrio coralii]
MVGFKHATVAFLLSATFAAQALGSDSAYIGLYQSSDWEPSFVKVTEENGQLFFHSFQGIAEIKLTSDDHMVLKHVYAKGKFGDLDDGQYQYIDYVDPTYTKRFHRIEPDENINISTAHRTSLLGEDISNSEQCSTDEFFEPTLSLQQKLTPLWKSIEKRRFGNINSILVAKNGELVAEHYFNGYHKDEKHTVQSVTKSIVSMLAGTAIDARAVESVNSPIAHYLPKYEKLFKHGKASITLKHTLSMTAGLEWDEWSKPYSDPTNVRLQQILSDDAVEFTIKQPLAHDPGSHYAYSGGFVDLTSEVIANATESEDAADYFRESPLAELCFDNAGWMSMLDGRPGAGGGMLLRPRDMLKLGQLMLDDGKWQGKQLLSQSWIEESTQSLNTVLGMGYGYYWWTRNYTHNYNDYAAVLALGWGDQSIIIIDELDLVIVTNGYNFAREPQTHRMVSQYILPAVLDGN